MTSVGIMASAVVVVGRHRRAARAVQQLHRRGVDGRPCGPDRSSPAAPAPPPDRPATADQVDYTIPGANESDTSRSGSPASHRRRRPATDVIAFRSDAGATDTHRLIVDSPTATTVSTRRAPTPRRRRQRRRTDRRQHLVLHRGPSPAARHAAVRSSCGSTAPNVINATGSTPRTPAPRRCTTRSVLGVGVAGIATQYDDLYLTTGAGAAFKGDITIP